MNAHGKTSTDSAVHRWILLVVAVVVAAIDFATYDDRLPVGGLLIPVLALAVVAGPRVTALGAVATSLAAFGFALSAGHGTVRVKLVEALLVCIGAAIAVGFSRMRVRYNLLIQQTKAASYAATAITVRMVDSLQVLARASTLSAVYLTACEVARDLFESDSASIWDASVDPAVLVCRVPADQFAVGTPASIGQAFAPSSAVGNSAHSVFFTRDAATRLSAAASEPGSPAAGVATPIRIAGRVVAYLALSWDEPRVAPSKAWLTVLDRYAVNVAVALSVVRRQAAQDEVQRLALRLQNGLLPTSVNVQFPLQIATIYRPGERRLMLGGDFLDVVPTDDGRLAFIVGDVAGHGPEEAALGTILRSAWAGLASSGDLDPGKWANILDGILRRRRDDDNTFVTAAIGVIDPRARTLTYVLAGHPPPFQLVPLVSDLAMPQTPPLGMLSRPAEQIEVALPEGFGLLVFTDGLFDGFDVSGERLGFHGLRDLVARYPKMRTSEHLTALVTEVERMNGGPLGDDVAVLLITHEGLSTTSTLFKPE